LAWGARHIQRRRDWDLLFDMARDRSCIFDVGAKVGMTAIAMARGQKDGVVYAFEASEFSSMIINRNLALNQLKDRVVTVNGIVGARSGILFEYHWNLVSGRSGIATVPPQGATPIQKASFSLDDFVRESGLRPDLIKVDVEGGERQVMAGMTEIMRGIGPDIIVELHAWPEMTAAANAAEILAMLQPLDYGMYWIARDMPITDASAFDNLDEAPRGAQARARVLLTKTDRPPPMVLKNVDVTALDM
jgi:FkbM family methyltransferase